MVSGRERGGPQTGKSVQDHPTNLPPSGPGRSLRVPPAAPGLHVPRLASPSPGTGQLGRPGVAAHTRSRHVCAGLCFPRGAPGVRDGCLAGEVPR